MGKQMTETEDGVPQRYMSVEQVAHYLGRTATSIYRLVERGRIPYSKAGGRLTFDRVEIDRWVEKGRQVSTREAVRSAA